MVLDESRSKAAIEEKVAKPLGISLEEALLSMEKAYQEKIAKALAVYQNQADDVTLLAFGGAGPMSACGVARAAGIKEIIVPRLAAVFSAFGISFSDIAHEYQATIKNLNGPDLQEKLDQLEERAKRDMFAEGFDISECTIHTHLSFSRNGEYQIIPFEQKDGLIVDIAEAQDIRLHLRVVKPIAHFNLEETKKLKEQDPAPVRRQSILHAVGQRLDVPVYRFEDLQPGACGVGPALIEDEYFTCRILEGWKFVVNENKDIFIRDEGGKA
jgi:N-methylhydantoinase A/oxoprolinase/acetone carboxylase beta subunit